jgi:hypothetical protein
VDESIVGDWPYVKWELGLGPQPPPRGFQPPLGPVPGRPFGVSDPLPAGQRKTAKERAKARRKQAAKARKQNRKRKKK